MEDMNAIVGEAVLASPLATKLQAMHNSPISAGAFHRNGHQPPSHECFCPGSSSVDDLHQLHGEVILPLPQAQPQFYHTHNLRPLSSSPPQLPPPHPTVEDAALINYHFLTHPHSYHYHHEPSLSHHSDVATSSLVHYASKAGSVGSHGYGGLSAQFDAAAESMRYDACDGLTSEPSLPFLKDVCHGKDYNSLAALDVQESTNAAGSISHMVSRGRNPHLAALSSSSSSSTPSSVSVTQLAKQNVQAWMAFNGSSSCNPSRDYETQRATVLMSNMENATKTEVEHKSCATSMGAAMGQSDQKKKRKKRKRTSHKNLEEMETQRMTHIAVERNRRKQMNEHLRALRLLMPQSYIQRGDQASIVGGTIRFVKELEHVLQSLMVQKQLRINNNIEPKIEENHEQFGLDIKGAYASTRSCIANVDVRMLTSTTILMKVLAQRKPHQLLCTLLAFSNLSLRVTHLNINTIGPITLYCFNLEMDNDCHLLTPFELAESMQQIFGACDMFKPL